MFSLYGLTEADGRLSASRLPRVTAAIPQGRQLFPVVAEQHQDLAAPGLRPAQIVDEGPRAGAGSLFPAHKLRSPGRPVGIDHAGEGG